ncbi:unnamed protein product [Polarella glacialis]|uniref:C962R-like N-terminal AEP domain-containing protein n=1 Tax=Polarella glacialis TaxID=89957 RepID=A0A813IMB8_POLGL|nr:unnamed protein product [Polarella glacialis]
MARNYRHEEVKTRNEWIGFDLVKVGSEALVADLRGNIVVISGCITTVSPMRQQANFDVTVANADSSVVPPHPLAFIAPTSMSRYDGIRQCGTNSTVHEDGRITINFTKSLNSMVLHFSGWCFNASQDEPTAIEVAASGKEKLIGKEAVGTQFALAADEAHPPAFKRDGCIVCLQGKLKEATFGFSSAYHVGTLPEGCRPCREVRCLASLLRDNKDDPEDLFIEHSIALTLRPDGRISVQGGKVHSVDQKGNMRILQQKKKGRLCLDGIRFATIPGQPLETSVLLQAAATSSSGSRKAQNVKAMLGLGATKRTAACICQGDIVMLEGPLEWDSVRPLHDKQAICRLPRGYWPRRREIFFTRGGSDLEERRRVDIDRYGRIFCPEGSPGNLVELDGIIFMAAPDNKDLEPADENWDELKLQYNRAVVDVVSNSFDGHELLEQFVRRCNWQEWGLLAYQMSCHSSRKMLLPLGDQVVLHGWENGNQWNLDPREHRLFQDVLLPSMRDLGITSFQPLLQVSDLMFDKIASHIKMPAEDYKHLVMRRRRLQQSWAQTKETGLTYAYLKDLATEIVDQMFEHWDFKSQLQGSLTNDFRAPKSIEHMFRQPQRYGREEKEIRGKISQAELPRFEEIRQFFYLYETTSSNMTHCSLMGSQDPFTTTGKWHFPDSEDVQTQLFDNIAWLYDRGICQYISERQTPKFPFIEDFDIQCATNWKAPDPGKERPDPPDELLVTRPVRDANNKVTGSPGLLLEKRAWAVHMIYPNLEVLEVLVYSASGYNKGKELLKSSFHLVWPQLLVDGDRAPVLRYVTLGIFKKETSQLGSFLNKLQTQLLQLDKSNEWELVFDKTTMGRNGLRLPYSDKVSNVIKDPEDKRKVAAKVLARSKAFTTRVKENRISKAIGVIRFEFEKHPETGEDRLKEARWVKDEDSMSKSDWIRQGSCRRDMTSSSQTAMTPWQLGPEVLAMLPRKPGEKYYMEGEGEDRCWATHRPYPNIRRCQLEPNKFKEQFLANLATEQDALLVENPDLRSRLFGAWIAGEPATRAVWRTTAARQCNSKVPDWLWGRGRIRRPTEVMYSTKTGKIMVDGPDEEVSAIIRALEDFTEPDDHPIMPLFDIELMNRY